jgi:hypothetical protein
MHHRQGPGVPLQRTDVDGLAHRVAKILRVQQVLDRRRIVATAGQSRFDSLL